MVLALFKALFSRRWWWKTLLVLAAMAVMARLGVWQLDRLEQRRAYNAELQAKLDADPLVIDGRTLDESPEALEDRKAVVRGRYDYDHQIAVKNQLYQGQPGVYLVTPLVIDGSDQAILVNRGWVPYREGVPDRWEQFDEPAGDQLFGYLQRSRTRPGGGASPTPGPFEWEWYWLDIEAIEVRMPHELLPVYLNVAPEEGRLLTALPVRVEPEVDLSEGSHMSYALQWFAFALIAGGVYVALVRNQEQERTRAEQTAQLQAATEDQLAH